jgi:outer membrane protein
MTRTACLLPAATLLLLAASACTSFDPARARADHTSALRDDLAARLAAVPARPLSLDDCLRIAVSNNYAARRADLDLELARLGKNVAFTAFLPQLAVSSGYTSRDYANIMGATAAGELITGPKRDSSTSLTAAWPVFMPSTWFLYAAARHGYAAANVAAAYTRQNIVLQTTSAYCDVLVQLDTIAALETQLDAAQRLADRLSGLAAEGLVASWEEEQANFQLLARQSELDAASRRLALLRATLLQTLGLPPDAPIELSGDTGESRLPEGTLEDLVLLALETHPQLLLADRQVVMKEHAVRQAFCAFLPTLSLSATHVWGGEDLAFDAVGWMTGFSAAWQVFSGFANLARYRAAKVERAQTELERENTFLSVIVSVISARNALEDARAAVALRQKAFDVLSAKADDFASRAEEGLLPLHEALDARAERDLAQVELVRSRCLERVAVANLELALGITPLPAPDPPSQESHPSQESQESQESQNPAA